MHETLAKELVELASMPPAASAMTYAPRRSIYTPIMELGPKDYGLGDLNSIMVVYMDPLGVVVK